MHMRTLRPWIAPVLAIPTITVLVAFVLAQSQLIRLVGRAEWTIVLWPNLEWLLGAACIAVWYRRDWPRWSWTMLAQTSGEACIALGSLTLLVWATGTDVRFGAWDWSAFVTLVCILPALLLWSIAEETILRGVVGRRCMPYRASLRPIILLGVAALVTMLLQPITTPLVLVGAGVLEVLSIVGVLAGNSLGIVATRRWAVRTVIIALGIPGVGFAVNMPALTQLGVTTPILGVLLVSSLCVLWSCLIALQWARSAPVNPAALQQNAHTDV
jgi:hypothetical protein